MAFTSTLLTTGEACDKCGKPFSYEHPGMSIYQSSGSDRNIILIHIECMQKQIRKVEKENIRP